MDSADDRLARRARTPDPYVVRRTCHHPYLDEQRPPKAAGCSHADMSVTAPEQFPLFVLGEFCLRRMPTVAWEFSPFSPSGYGQVADVERIGAELVPGLEEC
jgi:hypothetical protein